MDNEHINELPVVDVGDEVPTTVHDEMSDGIGQEEVKDNGKNKKE